MTQAQLAEAANLHQSQVSRFERGERSPSIEQASAIANALGCTVASLLPASTRAA
jgi:transcriptional regulator with XRE-family HTH domain